MYGTAGILTSSFFGVSPPRIVTNLWKKKRENTVKYNCNFIFSLELYKRINKGLTTPDMYDLTTITWIFKKAHRLNKMILLSMFLTKKIHRQHFIGQYKDFYRHFRWCHNEHNQLTGSFPPMACIQNLWSSSDRACTVSTVPGLETRKIIKHQWKIYKTFTSHTVRR